MALPHYAYGDPAKLVESNQLHKMGCNGCARSERILGKTICSNDLKYPACRRDSKKGYKLSRAAGGDE
ncbi:hypothetical protein JET76_23160 [Pseudomonas putida]|uniref:hypothetical protein n=1 Tax=Pseudomonas putida TaxID=303 RepID=UPI0018E67B32|nr:hypothetical protein [Pseudomonas putida]MBI6944229.1 hypothetical protein [Pseudomonas putida]MBI6960330.1 hypothetical protein [Pseudomonas putida]